MSPRLFAISAIAAASLATSAHSRPCDAIQKESGEFWGGKSFSGEVIQVVDAKIIRISPLMQADNTQQLCEVELSMFGPDRVLSPAESERLKSFLTNFVLHGVVTCMPISSVRARVGGRDVVTIWRGERVVAACNVDYPIDFLLQKLKAASPMDTH